MENKRKIIEIDESKCDGCGLCIPNCPEGALRVIDGKARLVSDLLCDGLGACLGECPKGAIRITERTAQAYDERKVMENMLPKGANTIKAHLNHLKDHGQKDFLRQAVEFLKERNLTNPLEEGGHIAQDTGHRPKAGGKDQCGCPGARAMSFGAEDGGMEAGSGGAAAVRSQLRQWPVQLHLVSPLASYFKKADVVLAADCAAYAHGNFHNEFLKNKALAIACPKLDEGQESYVEKLIALIDVAEINALTVIIMEVPCCGGLLSLARTALGRSKRKIPLKCIVIGLQGGIKSESNFSD
jgi:NAD-dependent dihydropyrimidine dehydrogenase PreA subunit